METNIRRQRSILTYLLPTFAFGVAQAGSLGNAMAKRYLTMARDCSIGTEKTR
jgi:hypothetical protein